MEALRKYRFAVLSYAHFHAYSYSRAVKELPNSELVAVYDDDPERGRRAAEQYNAVYYEDYEELLRRADIDAVIIDSENVKHRALAVASAEAGKHILCEKPIATTLEDADAIVRAVEKAKVKFQTCFVMRYNPPALRVKEIIDSGEIGEITAITGTNHIKWFGIDVMKWFVNPELSGGGAVMDHTVHLADLMRWYTGSEASRVYCEIGKNIRRELAVEDNFLTMIRFRDGAVGTVDGSWSRPENYHYWGDVTMEIIGTEGMILLDAFRQVLYLTSENSKGLEWQFYAGDTDKEMVRHFIRCMEEDLTPRATAFDGRQATEITIASYESAREHRAVDLPLKTR
jgi:predicted dehydrogenase